MDGWSQILSRKIFDELIQFKFKDPKAIGTIEKLKQYIKNIKNKIKRDIGLKPTL